MTEISKVGHSKSALNEWGKSTMVPREIRAAQSLT